MISVRSPMLISLLDVRRRTEFRERFFKISRIDSAITVQTERLLGYLFREALYLFERSHQDDVGPGNGATDRITGDGGIPPEGKHLLLDDIGHLAFDPFQKDVQVDHLRKHRLDPIGIHLHGLQGVERLLLR